MEFHEHDSSNSVRLCLIKKRMYKDGVSVSSMASSRNILYIIYAFSTITQYQAIFSYIFSQILFPNIFFYIFS